MSTIEIIIVFAALMALIALVTIGIDWIGKPLKHRRFIPRLYRFDDEKLPVDAYGHPQLDGPQALPKASLPPAVGQGAPWTPPVVYQQAPPVVVATVPEPLTAASAPKAPPLQDGQGPDAESTLDYAAFAEQAAGEQTADAGTSTSAFSDRLLGGGAGASASATDDDTWASSGLVPEAPSARSTSWEPGMPLDATINDERPSLAAKAERYWQATAAAVEESHFDADAISRMANGRAPRRRNPRTSRIESMQLTGLRQASTRSDVRMSWPDDAVDPWAAS